MAFLHALSDTWNDGATTFNALKLDVTDTASAAGSKLFDFQIGGVSKGSLDKDGDLVLAASVTSVGATITGTLDVSGIGNKSTVRSDLAVPGDADANDFTGANSFLAGASFTLKDPTDDTKLLRFDLSGITTGTTRTKTLQDVSGTLYETGGVDVSVVDGGTGASTVNAALTNLGLGKIPLIPQNEGVSGTASGSDQTAPMIALFDKAISEGRPIYFPKGTYRLPAYSVTGRLTVLADKEAVFDIYDQPANNQGIFRFLTGSEHSKWVGGKINGRRDSFLTVALTGTWSSSTTTLTGSGGNALSEVSAGDFIRYNGRARTVAAVVNDNQITLEYAFTEPVDSDQGQLGGFFTSEFTGQTVFHHDFPPQPAVIELFADDIEVDGAQFIETMQQAILYKGSRIKLTNLYFKDCGAMIRGNDGPGSAWIEGGEISNIYGEDIGHDGSEFNRHPMQAYRHRNPYYNNITVLRSTGNNDDQFLSGFTFVDVEGGTVDSVRLLDFNTDNNEVGMSIEAVNTVFINCQVTGCTGSSFEAIECSGVVIDNFKVDGQFRSSKLRPYGSATGIQIRNSQNSRGGAGRREPLIIKNHQIRNLYGIGILAKGCLVDIYGGVIEGCQAGIRGSVDSGVTPTRVARIRDFDTSVRYCDLYGFLADSNGRMVLHGGEFINNGQDSTAADAVRAGLSIDNMTEPFDIRNKRVEDNQGSTISSAVSCSNATSTSVTRWEGTAGSASEVTYYRWTLEQDAEMDIAINQRVVIAGVNGGNPGRIIDIKNLPREITIEYDNSSAITATFVGAALTTVKSQRHGIDLLTSPGYIASSLSRGHEFADQQGFNMRSSPASLVSGSEYLVYGEDTNITSTDTMLVNNWGNEGASLVGWRWICTETFAGITAWSLDATETGGGTLIKTLDSGSSLNNNTRLTGSEFNVIAAGASPDIRLRTTGTPTAGGFKVEALCRKNSLDDFEIL